MPEAFTFLSFRAETWPTCWKHVFDLKLVRFFRFFSCAHNGLSNKIPRDCRAERKRCRDSKNFTKRSPYRCGFLVNQNEFSQKIKVQTPPPSNRPKIKVFEVTQNLRCPCIQDTLSSRARLA